MGTCAGRSKIIRILAGGPTGRSYNADGLKSAPSLAYTSACPSYLELYWALERLDT